MSEQKHPYHLVDPSPWPIVAAVSALVMFLGLISYMHDDSGSYPMVFAIGAGFLIFTAYKWWVDVVREAEYEGHHSKPVEIGLRYGMALFIASEVMFFLAWFWAFFDVSLYPGANSPELVARNEFLGGVWPPEQMEGKLFNPWEIPFLNTIILLSSGGTVTWAHHALRQDDRKNFLIALFITIALGIAFTSLQAHEYDMAQFTFAFDLENGTGGIYPSTFFMATGFHGAHVIIGTLFLIVCFVRGMLGHFRPDHHFGFEAAAWYWHFVDVVWLFLFSAIYWWAGP